MKIDSIGNGIVLDHIRAGRAMDIYKHLKLEKLSCSVAIIMNVKSTKMGQKDIIKIDAPIELDLDILGYIDPEITVNIIKDSVLSQKKDIQLPPKLVNVLKCKNPRCITSAEQELEHVFLLTDNAAHIYRCAYCETQSGR